MFLPSARRGAATYCSVYTAATDYEYCFIEPSFLVYASGDLPAVPIHMAGPSAMHAEALKPLHFHC